ncbi:amylo-alpha-1,6-glucosidase [Deinococcus sonorensis]|uniref:Amylo-alpha-1,6-glucosidase n=2 Tax=Deinococcus sonorensis TaxID=309891 RepID=A0AAU7UES1_9DEIO
MTAFVSAHRLGPQDVRDLQREVLLTDGLGGFALSSPAGVPTRCYSGLARSLTPPTHRHLMFISALETLEVAGERHTLHAFEVAPGAVEGDGLNRLSHVDLHDLLPTRVQVAGGVRVERRSVVPRHSGTLALLYTLHCPQAVTLTLGALLTDRDMHLVCRDMPALTVDQQDQQVTVRGQQTLGLTLHAPTGTMEVLPARPYPQRLYYRLDQQRGAPDTEQAARTDLWRVQLPAGTHHLALVVGDPAQVPDPWASLEQEQQRRAALIRQTWAASGVADDVTATLAVSADSFLVRRELTDSTTVIAGYPWFADWGRDSMIALSGLTLTTGRLPDARSVLDTFLRHLRRGLTPNHFHDGGTLGGATEGAGYNTVDGALWLAVGLERYVQASGDLAFARAALTALRGILQHHVDGTDYGIRADPDDGLLWAGEAGVQLTWMDVKIEDWVVTPRHGKPIEVQALWLAALGAEQRLSDRLGEAGRYEAWYRQAQASFGRFWDGETGRFADSLTPDGPDPSVRPNALIALALPDTPAAPEQRHAALQVAARELATPLGLHTLSRRDPRYRGNYGGHQLIRDAAYHQGTVWPWPHGAYAELLLQAGQVQEAAEALDGLVAHLWDAGLGSVSEVFSGDTLMPGGCAFQAWSVAELLRVYVLVQRARQA